jgi:1-acyl-sn-glycerol-3-phosphate acyltransferase
MAPHHTARLRFFALGEAVFLHAAVVVATAVYALRVVSDNVYAAYLPGVHAGWLGLSAVPVLVMAPAFGVLAGSRWNWCVQLGASVFVLTIVSIPAVGVAVPWLGLAGAAALGSAAFGIAVLGNIATITRAARVRVPPAVAFLTLAGGGGALLGFFGGLDLAGTDESGPLAKPCAISMGAAVIAVFVCRFPPPAADLSAGVIRPFAAGSTDAGQSRVARAAIVGLWFWGFLFALFLVGVLRTEVAATAGGHPDDLMLDRARVFGWAFLGGALLTLPARFPVRHGGFALVGATVGLISAIWLAMSDRWGGPVVGLGLGFGASLAGLLNLAFTWTRPGHHGVTAALITMGWCLAGLGLVGVLAAQNPDATAARTPLMTILIVVGGIATVGAWLALFRPALELTAETLLWPLYRITGHGPGATAMPARGPYLVIANHAAWLDPLFLAKVVPAPIVPMMTSKFYDLPVISFLMRRTIGTIRVPDVAYRHEAPELKEAVRALDRGEALIVFPEGFLRRKEEVMLRRFGRGVWQILHDRPDTPIYACWIDGNWGSYTSFKGGPPMKNKRPDFWRRVRIGIRGPFRLDAATLADHMATRTALMHEVAKAREPLGLEPLTLAAAPEGDEG